MQKYHNLFSEEEWYEMISTSKEATHIRLFEHSGILNHGICQHINFTGKFQMPVVKPLICEIPTKIIAYYRTTTGKYTDGVPHFYTNEKNYEWIWNQPYKIINDIPDRKKRVIGPDFSVYAELVFPQKIWNIFRNKLLTAWWQYNGIDVIPNISWINEDYNCSFEGWPQNSIIAVNSTGVGRNERCRKMWIKGYAEMIERLQPRHIIRYGVKLPGEHEAISTYFTNDNKIMANHGW